MRCIGYQFLGAVKGTCSVQSRKWQGMAIEEPPVYHSIWVIQSDRIGMPWVPSLNAIYWNPKSAPSLAAPAL